MSIQPIITFKAGTCTLDTSSKPAKVKANPTPGYIYLYSEEDLMHFCWRPRSASLDDPELDLIMFPADGTFVPYEPTSAENPRNPKKPTDGRIYSLKFSSSSQRHLFWLQSRSQHPTADPAWFSARDLKLGQIVNNLLQGEEVNVQEAIANLPHDGDDRNGDDDEPMEDVEGMDHDSSYHGRSGSGGAGPGATGGDIREEGADSRDGGADGGRAAAPGGMDASSIIQSFVRSMGQSGQSGAQGKLFTTLQDLLTPNSTIPYIDEADVASVDNLLQYLPPALVTLAQSADDAAALNADHASIEASAQAMSLKQKKDLLRKVLRSPQFTQSLSSLTIALRDGGLPSISEALDIPVEHGGYMRRGGVPLGGGEAVEAFLNGVKQKMSKGPKSGDDQMDTQE